MTQSVGRPRGPNDDDSTFVIAVEQFGSADRPTIYTTHARRHLALQEPQWPLIMKIRSLSPERVAEVEDFVDFLTVRDQDRQFTLAVARLSEEAFRAVWDNSDDAEYDRL